MARAALILLIIINLAMLVYSGRFFISEVGFSWKSWLIRDLTAVPLMLFTLGGISGSLLILNVSAPFLVIYGLFYPASWGFTFLGRNIAFLVVILDLIYITGANINIKSARDLFWGLSGGILLFLAYHNLQFGVINLGNPLMKVVKGFIDYLESIF